MPRLTCSKIVYYSHADEAGFFAALSVIKAIKRVEGVEDALHLTVPTRLSESSLRDLLGVFYRFGIDMTQLRQFETPQNRGWFCDKKAFWFDHVFKSKSP